MAGLELKPIDGHFSGMKEKKWERPCNRFVEKNWDIVTLVGLIGFMVFGVTATPTLYENGPLWAVVLFPISLLGLLIGLAARIAGLKRRLGEDIGSL